MGVGGCDERGISIFVLNFEQTPRTVSFQVGGDCNSPIFNLECINQNYVNDVNTLAWILSVKLKAKA